MSLYGFLYDFYWYHYPFSLERIIARKIRGYKIICDLGCGKGIFATHLKFINNPSLRYFGIDIFLPYLYAVKDQGAYHCLLQSDLRNLPIKDGSFDAVICVHTLEHLEKSAEYIRNFERVAKHKIIFVTPKGYVHNPSDETVHQKHLSGYGVDDFKNLGYTVKGFGCRPMRQCYKPGIMPLFLRPLFSVASLLATVITYHFPGLGADYLIAIKNTR
jgi:ubiquinone/menaquinone biosynthesis C-methylase UbiE